MQIIQRNGQVKIVKSTDQVGMKQLQKQRQSIHLQCYVYIMMQIPFQELYPNCYK